MFLGIYMFLLGYLICYYIIVLLVSYDPLVVSYDPLCFYGICDVSFYVSDLIYLTPLSHFK